MCTTDGIFLTGLMIKSRGNKPLEGSIRRWGTECPIGEEVLEFYREWRDNEGKMEEDKDEE